MKIEKKIINKIPFATSRLARSCAASGVINLGIFFIFVILLTNCFSPLGGQDEIGVTISLGSGQGRFTAASHERRVIVVTTPGGEQTIELSSNQTAVTISGRPGTWNILVMYYDNDLQLPEGGANISIDIQMGPPINIEPAINAFLFIPISNETDLRRIAVVQDRPNVLNKDYILTRSISLSSAPWIPIGTDLLSSATQYTGTFDGNGYTISGLTINNPNSNNQGMFGIIGNGGEVKNLGLINVNITGNNNVGGLVGIKNNNTTIQHSYVTGTVNGNENIGGVAGTNNGTVQNSYSTGTVTGNQNIGGVVGINNSGSTVRNSYSTGTVTGIGIDGVIGVNINESIANAGGVVGNNSGTVANSYSTGTVSGTGSSIGGVAGLNTSIVEYSYATGSVSGINAGRVGGVVGRQEGSSSRVRYVYATGAVSGSSGIGGVVGYMSSSSNIQHSYSTSNVNGAIAGGVVGQIWSGNVEYSYATGAVSSTSSIGGVVGGINTANIVRNSLALNPSLTGAIASSLGRIVGSGSLSTMLNNYARSDMQFSITPDPDGTFELNGKHGEDITVADYHSASWWTNAGNWDGGAWDATNAEGNAIWDIAPGRLPRLNGVGGNQNPSVN